MALIITDTIAHLRATAMPPLMKVDGAAELETLAAGTAPQHGHAFVAPFEERGSANTLATGGFRQLVDVTLLVAVVLRASDDPRGARRIDAADELRIAIESALAGWSPDEQAHLPFEFVAARSAPQKNGVTWYVQTWRTNRWIESET